MRTTTSLKHGALGTAIAAALALGIAAGAPSRAIAQPTASAPTNQVLLSVGKGQMVRLASPMSDLFVADDKVADVQVRSARQVYIFGKAAGETTVYATDKAGKVVYSANVRVGGNYDGLSGMLSAAMPDSRVVATPMNGVVLLTGTVASPGDVAEAATLTQAFVGDGIKVVNKIKSAISSQVNLQVRIVEVRRDFLKSVGVNLLSRDMTGGFLFGVSRGNPGTIKDYVDPNSGTTFPGVTEYGFRGATGVGTTIGLAGRFLGLDLLGALDLAETDGFLTTLANPNLTALSGETASFLAGGEIPIPVAQELGRISVEYKQYGVSLSFTPIVLADGRISMRVRPEVSELSNAGAVELNNFNIPAFTTRRAETTVELGSGQSFMLAGLLSNINTNSLNKAPFLGDIPILGQLFRSTSYRRQETELVIVVTPYLVRPVSANQIALPSDGFKAPTDAQAIIGAQTFEGVTGGQRPRPRSNGPLAPAPQSPSSSSRKSPAAAPGFSF